VRSFKIPGKVFLLGEYAVLRGGPAIVATTTPYFSATTAGIESGVAPSFHPESPAGRLQSTIQSSAITFEDPYSGQGGFGASTAQFALSFALSQGKIDSWEKPYQIYRELTAGEAMPPSGADLIAQWCGGVVFWCPRQHELRKMSSLFPWRNLLVFSATHQAGRKVVTHEHLDKIKQSGILAENSPFLRNLESLTKQGGDAIESNQSRHFATVLNAYGDQLAQQGLELKQTSHDRDAFRAIRGVLAAKGAGAMQADSILVYVEGEAAKEAVLKVAAQRNLRTVASALAPEAGIQEIRQ